MSEEVQWRKLSCTCEACAGACKRIPGVFAPLEALRAVHAGHAQRMVETRMDSIIVLMPLADGEFSEGHYRDGAYSARGRCTFLSGSDRCELHETGFKPKECREALLCGEGMGRAEGRDLEASWNTRVGHLVRQLWHKALEGEQK